MSLTVPLEPLAIGDMRQVERAAPAGRGSMKTLQQQATEMLETIDSVEGEKKYARLTPSDRALIFRLAAKGNCTQASPISRGAFIGTDERSVRRSASESA